MLKYEGGKKSHSIELIGSVEKGHLLQIILMKKVLINIVVYKMSKMKLQNTFSFLLDRYIL